MDSAVTATLEERIQRVLDEYRPTLYRDGGDVEVLGVDDKGVAHVKMLGACIDCPISILTMKLGIQRLLKEHFTEVTSVNAITDVSIADLYRREAGNAAYSASVISFSPAIATAPIPTTGRD
jgi:Fe-S cluster biogenesis protein NfuA